MSSSFGGDLEQFALTPSSADVISAPLRTSTHSEVLGKRTTPIAFAFFLRRTTAGSGFFAFLGSGFAQIFVHVVPFWWG